MSELIDREAVREFIKSYRHSTDVAFDMEKHLDEIPAAQRWHRVEEPPEPHKNVLVTGMEAINNSRVYKVMVNDNGTWRPTDYAPSIRWEYWMPIEPPKEDADGK